MLTSVRERHHPCWKTHIKAKNGGSSLIEVFESWNDQGLPNF